MWGRALALQNVEQAHGASTRWHAGRVRTYWIVDPGNESIEVHRLETGGYRLAERASGEDEVR
jgi:hypothetical protein